MDAAHARGCGELTVAMKLILASVKSAAGLSDKKDADLSAALKVLKMRDGQLGKLATRCLVVRHRLAHDSLPLDELSRSLLSFASLARLLGRNDLFASFRDMAKRMDGGGLMAEDEQRKSSERAGASKSKVEEKESEAAKSKTSDLSKRNVLGREEQKSNLVRPKSSASASPSNDSVSNEDTPVADAAALKSNDQHDDAPFSDAAVQQQSVAIPNVSLTSKQEPKKRKKKKKNKRKKKKNAFAELHKEGARLMEEKRFLEAMNLFTEKLYSCEGTTDPSLSLIFSSRAACEIELGKFELAREDLEDAIENDPQNVQLYRSLSALLLDKLDLVEEAACICQNGLRVNGRDPELLMRARNCKAIQAQKVTDKNPRPPNQPVTAANLMESFQQSLLRTPRPSDCQVLSAEESEEQLKMAVTVIAAHRVRDAAKSAEDFREAARLYEKAAALGSAEGMYNLGVFYGRSDRGFVRDFAKELELQRKAASQKPFYRIDKSERIIVNVGVAEAENALGVAYRDGTGVDVNHEIAASWFIKPAEHGCSWGQNNLGVALPHGYGLPQNIEAGCEWHLKAAEQGLAEAQLNYARSVEDDHPDTAKIWYEKAAAQGIAGAMYGLQKLERTGAVKSSSEPVTASMQRLIDSADGGNSDSQLLLGLNYFNGEGRFPKNEDAALKYFSLASDAGIEKGSLYAAKILLERPKAAKDAFSFVLKAAKAGSQEGSQLLAELYCYGHGCKRDKNEARKWFRRAQVAEADFKDTVQMGENLCSFEESKGFSGDDLGLNQRIHRHKSSFLVTPFLKLMDDVATHHSLLALLR